MAKGVGNILAAAFPGEGAIGGLKWPPESGRLLPHVFTTNEGAHIEHDSRMPSAALSSADTFAWIVNAWKGTEHGDRQPGPYGQVYRAVGTAAFGAWGLGLKAVGR